MASLITNPCLAGHPGSIMTMIKLPDESEMESKQSSFLVETMLQFGSLIFDFKNSCPQTVDQEFKWTFFNRIQTRWKHLDLILYRIEIDIDQLTRAREEVSDDISIDEVDFLVSAPSLDIETFFVVVRSFLDDVAILTPYFYPKGTKKPKRYSFSDQLKWYTSHPDFDPPMTDYIINNTGWFNEMKEVRDRLLHKQSDVLPINAWKGKDIPIGFVIIDKGDWSAFQPLKTIIYTILQNFMRLLNFYSSHFKDRLPNDWPGYKSLFGNPPKGTVGGLSFLKRWSESPL